MDVGWWKRHGWSGGAIIAAASTPLKRSSKRRGSGLMVGGLSCGGCCVEMEIERWGSVR